MFETALKIGESRSEERKRKRLERIATGRRKREELLQELAKRKRKELAELRSLEYRMKAWEIPKLEPATRKREKEWYHTEMQPKRRRVTPCCEMENVLCKECLEELQEIVLLEGTLVFKMDPETISSEYLKDSLLPVIRPAVLGYENQNSVRTELEKVVENVLQLPKIEEPTLSPVKSLIKFFDQPTEKMEKVTGAGGSRGKPVMAPRRAKRWVKKANGLFGWVTTSVKKNPQAQVNGGKFK